MAAGTEGTRVGALGGPRLAGRLTAELILRSPQYMSPLKQYELDLRGNKIGAIENLGATENQFDSIDLSDNNISRLEGFPRLLRLKQLLLNNNRIARIAKGCAEPIPNLEVLVLSNNKLSNLQDLDPLAAFTNLTLLSLLGNPVVTKPNYRLYIISKCKKLKVLDFKKVKQKEREDAAKMFPTEEAAAAHSANTFEVDADYEAQTAAAQQQAAADQAAAAQQAEAAAKKGPTQDQLIAIKAAIANAATMEEIRRLEEALTTGHLPSEFQIDSTQGDGGAAAAADGAAADGAADTDMPDQQPSGAGSDGTAMQDGDAAAHTAEANGNGNAAEAMAEG